MNKATIKRQLTSLWVRRSGRAAPRKRRARQRNRKRLVPLKASNDRSVGMAGESGDRVRSSRSRRALCCAGARRRSASYGRTSSCGLKCTHRVAVCVAHFSDLPGGRPHPGVPQRP
ncbi:hypothetical protein HaLaN_03713 [Haematococcus lacustris]|uniref:Uncharacterized protein n=1 Tax=Haematococcus lacustris TaxID=44745 RepID=A0A699YF82_HAELA|nr:hypothetical protein HaLaN_03713 [Haematococcus lacustris]